MKVIYNNGIVSRILGLVVSTFALAFISFLVFQLINVLVLGNTVGSFRFCEGFSYNNPQVGTNCSAGSNSTMVTVASILIIFLLIILRFFFVYESIILEAKSKELIINNGNVFFAKRDTIDLNQKLNISIEPIDQSALFGLLKHKVLKLKFSFQDKNIELITGVIPGELERLIKPLKRDLSKFNVEIN